jgi:starvation-inducible outer membrane lipoprotein
MAKLNNLQEYNGRKEPYTFTKFQSFKIKLWNVYLRYHCKKELKRLSKPLNYVYHGKT